MVNLVARNKVMRSKTLHSLHTLFPSILSLGVLEDVNETVITMPATREKTITEFITCKGDAQSNEPFGDGLVQTPCEFSSDVQLSVSRLTKTISRGSGGDIDANSFQSDLLSSVSHMMNIYRIEDC